MTESPGSLDLSGAARQTPAQWAVRWHGVVVFAVFVLVTPLFHLGWHGLAGRDEPIVRHNATQPRPAWSWAALLDGTFQKALESWLQEDSPVVWWLRGSYRELLWHCDLLQTEEVHVGVDRWLFQRSSLHPDPALLARRERVRRARFAAIAAEARELGIGLLAVVVPDKERVYPERAYPAGQLPADKAGLYGRILRELDDAGIAAVDLATPLAIARGAMAEPIYQPGDTHWSAPGALLAAQVVVPALLERFPDRLPAASPARITGPTTVEGLEDLVGQLGLCITRRHDAALRMDLARPASLTTIGLLRKIDYYGVEFADAGAAGGWRPCSLLADAPVALAGSSFSRTHFGPALAFALQRPVDRRTSQDGADSAVALAAAFDAIRDRSSTARVVVWEFVERSYLEGMDTPWRASR